jgi:hypothetical protein
MGVMKVMHPVKGHATMTWDTADKQSVAETRAAFDELVSNGMTGIVGAPGEEVATREFDPKAEEITVIAPLHGG